MRVLISGGTGMIGSSLAESLLADGHDVWILTRKDKPGVAKSNAHIQQWDGRTLSGWGDLVNHIDAVVNLAGERLAKWPWTKRQKQSFWDSRVDAGRVLTEAVRAAPTPPKVFIQASGVNYYGPHGLELLSEDDSPGSDFLARLSLTWEDSTKPVEELGVRRAVIRSGIVLSKGNGILPIMMLPIRLFVGGPLGNGKQGLSWIHIDDEVRAIRFLLETATASGPFNLTVPRPISSSEFLRQLAKVLRRPYWFPVPAFLLRLVLGEMSDLVLTGGYLRPKRLLDAGFHFKYENIGEALTNLLSAD